MTQAELAQALKSLGMPVACDEFKKKVKPPYIVYQRSYNTDLMADNQNYLELENFQIELYTVEKDLVAEKALQDKLKELRLPYRKADFPLESEGLFQVIYEIQLIGG